METIRPLLLGRVRRVIRRDCWGVKVGALEEEVGGAALADVALHQSSVYLVTYLVGQVKEPHRP